MLEGSYFWFLGETNANRLVLPTLPGQRRRPAGARLRRARLPPLPRRHRLPRPCILAILVQSAFTLSGLEATHLLILLPFPCLLIGAFAMLAGGNGSR